MQNGPYIMLPGKNLKMHLFRNVTFLYYHNRAITVVANTMGSKKHLSRVIKSEIFKREKSGVSARLWLPVGTGKVAGAVSPLATPPGHLSSRPLPPASQSCQTRTDPESQVEDTVMSLQLLCEQ